MPFAAFFQTYDELAADAAPIGLFGWQHIGLLLLTCLGGFFLFCFRSSLRKSPRKDAVRLWMAGLLFCNMLLFYLTLAGEGTLDWRVHLPLHLCHITGYVMMVVLLTGSRRVFSVLYFFTFLGPRPAMLFPNTPTDFTKFYTWNFVISHHLLLLCGLYCLTVLQWKVRWRDLAAAFGCGLVLFLAVNQFNLAFGTNYIMTAALPQHLVEQFPFLADCPLPFLWLAGAGGIALMAAYLPTVLLRKSDQKLRRQALRLSLSAGTQSL